MTPFVIFVVWATLVVVSFFVMLIKDLQHARSGMHHPQYLNWWQSLIFFGILAIFWPITCALAFADWYKHSR